LPILRAAIPPWRDPYNILFGCGWAKLWHHRLKRRYQDGGHEI